ncbi:hypothetical protein [Brevifollis gellanilyticus]|uniref:Uncharacterized protein n=1 Tax=Brevifollis gellanilyticus TaxID=748831 RepID=A0A512M2F7_9BACT|nr:hypothetical protein [Brevifollis gellanilyticus]GEP40915.1 hypothetical protein BGE01nite_02060 [Brevifollis gellanilyticus]
MKPYTGLATAGNSPVLALSPMAFRTSHLKDLCPNKAAECVHTNYYMDSSNTYIDDVSNKAPTPISPPETRRPLDTSHWERANKAQGLLAKMGADESPRIPPRPLQPCRLADMRIQEAATDAGIPVRTADICKPNAQVWFRCLGEEQHWHLFHTFTPQGESDSIYFVSPDIVDQLGSIVRTKRLVPYITLQSLIRFWPITESGRFNSWNDSAREIAGAARLEWRRMTASLTRGRYESLRPSRPKPDPEPVYQEELDALLERALADKWILTLDHPAVRDLF